MRWRSHLCEGPDVGPNPNLLHVQVCGLIERASDMMKLFRSTVAATLAHAGGRRAALAPYSTSPAPLGPRGFSRSPHPIESLVDRLHYTIEEDHKHRPHTDIFSLPNTKRVVDIVTLLRKIMFPGIFEDYHVSNENIRYHLGGRRAVEGGAPRAVRQVGYFEPVFPDGQGDCVTTVSPYTGLLRFLVYTQSKNSDDELKQTMFHMENARLLSESAVFAMCTYPHLPMSSPPPPPLSTTPPPQGDPHLAHEQ